MVPLLNSTTLRGTRYWTAVRSSLAHMWKPPSPIMANSGRSRLKPAPIAAGMACPREEMPVLGKKRSCSETR